MRISNVRLDGLFDRFARADLNVCVMRGYERLPHEVENDLDVMIAPSDVGQFRSELLGFAHEMGLQLVAVSDHFFVTLVRFVGIDEQRTISRLIVDEHTRGEGWLGIPYLSNEEVLTQAQRNGSWLIPRPAHEGAMALFSHLLIGKRVKQKHLDRLPLLIAEDASEFQRILVRAFGIELSRRVLTAAMERNRSDLESSVWALRRALLRRTLRNNLGSTRSIAQDRLAQLSLKAQMRGMCVQIPDDSDPLTHALFVARALRLVLKEIWFIGDSFRQAPKTLGFGTWIPRWRLAGVLTSMEGTLRERLILVAPEVRSHARVRCVIGTANDSVETVHRVISILARRRETNHRSFALG